MAAIETGDDALKLNPPWCFQLLVFVSASRLVTVLLQEVTGPGQAGGHRLFADQANVSYYMRTKEPEDEIRKDDPRYKQMLSEAGLDENGNPVPRK